MYNISEVNRLIQNRRSIYPKQFDPASKVDDSIIKQMLENANWAPTHGMTEPWRFKVFTGAGLVKLGDFFQQIYKDTTPAENFDQGKYDKQALSIKQSSHVIAIIMKRQETGRIPEIEEIASVAAAVQNMYLTATAYDGVGGYWSTGGPTFKPQAKEFFGLGEQDRLMGFFYVGAFSGDWPKGNRKPIEEKVDWVY
jgi:nitroreductase